jgi:hypothetical protein
MPNASTSKFGAGGASANARPRTAALASSASFDTGTHYERRIGSAYNVGRTDLIDTIQVSTTDNVVSYPLCPCANFTWLYQVAQAYEHFKFREITITYRGACAATNDGMVAIAYEVDPSDSPPTSLKQISTYPFKSLGAAWETFSVTVPVERFLTRKWLEVGAGTQPPTEATLSESKEDIHETVQGMIHVWTDGAASQFKGGMLLITYDILLDVPSEVSSPERALTVGGDPNPALSADLPTLYSSSATAVPGLLGIMGSNSSWTYADRGIFIGSHSTKGFYITVPASYAGTAWLLNVEFTGSNFTVAPARSSANDGPGWVESPSTAFTVAKSSSAYYQSILVVPRQFTDPYVGLFFTFFSTGATATAAVLNLYKL